MTFRIQGLSSERFVPLMALSDAALAGQGIRRVVADEKPGFPCRVTLEDAEPGERLLLLNFEHQPANSPYRATGPIFVREDATSAFDGTTVPEQLRCRLLSLRAYDAVGMMVDADVTEGAAIETLLERLFANPATEYVHVHFARRGCFAARVERA